MTPKSHSRTSPLPIANQKFAVFNGRGMPCDYPRVLSVGNKFVQWKAFKPPVVYTTDRSKAVVPMLFLFCVAL